MGSAIFALSFLHLVATAFAQTSTPNTVSETDKFGDIIIDLSRAFVKGIPRYPIFSDIKITNLITKLQGKNNLLKHEELDMSTHIGTHMDTPCHLTPGTFCLDDIPFERLVSVPVAVIDVTSKVFPPNSSVQEDYAITVPDIQDWEAKYQQQLPDNGVAFFYTGWQRYWDDPALYQGTDSAGVFHSPGLSPEGAKWLATNRSKLYGVGTDTLTLDIGKSQSLLAHNYVSAANMYILENLMNLDMLPITGARLNIGLMKLGFNASGAPARILAVYSPQVLK